MKRRGQANKGKNEKGRTGKQRKKMKRGGEANKRNTNGRRILLHYFRTESTAAYERNIQIVSPILTQSFKTLSCNPAQELNFPWFFYVATLYNTIFGS